MAQGGGSGLAALLWPVEILAVGIVGFLIGGLAVVLFYGYYLLIVE